MNQEINSSFLITKRFRSPTEFSQYIEERVVKERIGYIDAIVNYCHSNDVDVESVGNLVTQSLKDKIQLEAEDSNMMKPCGKLPV